MKKLFIIVVLFLGTQVYSQSKDELLFQSVQNNNKEKTTQLLSGGGNANYYITGSPYKTVSLLITAVNNKNLEIAKLLLENKADVNWQDDTKCSAIVYAAATGNLEMVKLLLQYGAFLNDGNGKDKTVLSSAKASGDKNLIAFIEEQGKKSK